MGYNKANSLCWQCKRAYGTCSWSHRFKPVKGWEAIPTRINGEKKSKQPEIQSYEVKKCPMFIQDRV
jgi:hypothetical protein